MIPARAQRVARFLRLVVIARHHVRPAHNQLAFLLGCNVLPARRINDPYGEARQRKAEVERCLAKLADPRDSSNKYVYMTSLRELNLPAAEGVPVYLGLLDSPADVVKQGALFALGEYGPQARPAVPRILELFQDPARKWYVAPEAARALVFEARDASVKALAELRALVRGIHPPVLADRGLADAIRALALDTPARISLASELTGRPPAPVESAAYFAVSELLANVSKHAEARQTWVDIRHTDEMLRIGVTDNGHGGAEPARGTGLRGIERRLAAFDGVLAINSPPGGPTAVTMEIPCALSSPKTSSC